MNTHLANAKIVPRKILRISHYSKINPREKFQNSCSRIYIHGKINLVKINLFKVLQSPPKMFAGVLATPMLLIVCVISTTQKLSFPENLKHNFGS